MQLQCLNRTGPNFHPHPTNTPTTTTYNHTHPHIGILQTSPTHPAYTNTIQKHQLLVHTHTLQAHNLHTPTLYTHTLQTHNLHTPTLYTHTPYVHPHSTPTHTHILYKHIPTHTHAHHTQSMKLHGWDLCGRVPYKKSSAKEQNFHKVDLPSCPSVCKLPVTLEWWWRWPVTRIRWTHTAALLPWTKTTSFTTTFYPCTTYLWVIVVCLNVGVVLSGKVSATAPLPLLFPLPLSFPLPPSPVLLHQVLLGRYIRRCTQSQQINASMGTVY